MVTLEPTQANTGAARRLDNPGKNKPARSYCVTIQAQTELQWPRLTEIFEENATVRYMIFGAETAPTTGSKHLQGYVEMHGATRLTGMKEIFGRDPHFEARRGTRIEARDYCKKDGAYKEWGLWIKGPGARSDCEEVGRDTLEHGSMYVAMNHPGKGTKENPIDIDHFVTELCNNSWTVPSGRINPVGLIVDEMDDPILEIPEQPVRRRDIDNITCADAWCYCHCGAQNCASTENEKIINKLTHFR